MLPFTVTLRPGRSLHDQIVFAVTKAIVTGQLQAGDRFPAVRVVSQELRINPNTAQKAVTTAEAQANAAQSSAKDMGQKAMGFAE